MNPPLFDAKRICLIRKLRIKTMETNNAINSLSEPVIADLSLLGRVYEIFKIHMHAKYPSVDLNKPFNRKKFLAVALYLFSPGALAGSKMKVGLRERLSAILHLQTQTTVSGYISSLLILYHSYRSFRNDVEDVMKAVYRDEELKKSIR